MDRNYTYSYSGADCKAYAYFDSNESNLVQLDSLATISISVYEAKAPVRRLGHRGVSGFTKGIRTIAGSMVFLVIKDHPLWKLLNGDNFENSYSLDDNEEIRRSITKINERKLSSMLEPFNILLFFQTETVERKNEDEEKINFSSKGRASMLLEKIEIISEGIVSSVNDMVTEIQMQFIAKDFSAIENESKEFAIKNEARLQELMMRQEEEEKMKKEWDKLIEKYMPYIERGIVTLAEANRLADIEKKKQMLEQARKQERESKRHKKKKQISREEELNIIINGSDPTKDFLIKSLYNKPEIDKINLVGDLYDRWRK